MAKSVICLEKSLMILQAVLVLARISVSHPVIEDTPTSLSSSDDSLQHGSADAILAFALRLCQECDYFLNGCPPPSAIYGVNCPQNGTETCGKCEALQGSRIHTNNTAAAVEPHSIQKRSTCLHYGSICGNGFCCRNEGLRCQTNSEGRGRNHLVCAYD